METPELDYQQPIYGARRQRFLFYMGLAGNGLREVLLDVNYGPHVYELYARPDYMCLWVPSHWTFAGQGRRRAEGVCYLLVRILSRHATGGEIKVLHSLQPGAHFMRCRWQMLRWLDTQQGLGVSAQQRVLAIGTEPV